MDPKSILIEGKVITCIETLDANQAPLVSAQKVKIEKVNDEGVTLLALTDENGKDLSTEEGYPNEWDRLTQKWDQIKIQVINGPILALTLDEHKKPFVVQIE